MYTCLYQLSVLIARKVAADESRSRNYLVIRAGKRLRHSFAASNEWASRALGMQQSINLTVVRAL